MFQNLDVIVENGMLRPVTPLAYEDAHRLTIWIVDDHIKQGPDLSGISDLIVRPALLDKKRDPVTLEEAREIFAKIPPGEIERDLRNEREGRFQ
jgi:hypothetical protein